MEDEEETSLAISDASNSDVLGNGFVFTDVGAIHFVALSCRAESRPVVLGAWAVEWEDLAVSEDGSQ